MKKDKAAQDNFIALDVKKLEQIENERKKLLTAALREMPGVHFMSCPRCSQQLAEKNTAEIIVFICNQCGGVWIDASSIETVLTMESDRAESLFRTKTE